MTIRSHWRSLLAVSAAVVAVVAGSVASLSPAGADPVPNCHSVTLSENSGNGPTFKNLQLCNFTSRSNYLTVDGSPLQNGAVIFGSHVSAPSPSPSVPGAPAAVSSDPNGTHWHCYDLHPGFVAWNCISGRGFLYGDIWAGINDLYQHPHPTSDLVVGDTYFNPYFANGIPASDPQWFSRVILVNDGALHSVVEVIHWKVLSTASNPPAPTRCMTVTGPRVGVKFACPPLVVQSVVDFWNQGGVIPNRVLW